MYFENLDACPVWLLQFFWGRNYVVKYFLSRLYGSSQPDKIWNSRDTA